MDPNTTLKEIVEAAKVGDWDALSLGAYNLRNWLNNGGFMPEISREDLAELMHRLFIWGEVAADNKANP